MSQGLLGEPPARLSFSPPLPSLPETDRGESQTEGGVSGVEIDRGRSERERRPEWTEKQRLYESEKKRSPWAKGKSSGC